ncbi:TRIC cation channel family protein [Acaricomes phytoseiuli]|uniref:trimeric intracellular cation channel family protein n=1 Tax=Acaricomes phytoseiuli TaxID=291968 RepID=UPI0003652744|nr:TRIC cation channel family protein [Acaricomes phytoseiuli]MCW1250556.1 TRIC cation channel family protein [Acaricomes phytoseiuli]
MSIDLVLDLLGVFFFAVSGCLLAGHRGFDLIGSLLLGSLVGLGGGVIRDVVIGQLPAAFSNPLYLVPPVAAALLVFFLYPFLERIGRLLVICDAAGLALFCVTGTIKALNAGLNPVAAILLGVTTAVGGGLLRDVVANQVPQLFSAHDIYAIPAFMGAGLAALAYTMGWFNPLAGFGIAVLVFSFRVVAWHFGWQAPNAVIRHYRKTDAEG